MIDEPGARELSSRHTTPLHDGVGAVRGGSLLTLAHIVTGLGNYAYTLALANLLAPNAFGVPALIQPYLFFAALLVRAGLPWSTAWRFCVVVHPHEARGLLRAALVGNLVLAAAQASVLVAALAVGALKLGGEARGRLALSRWGRSSWSLSCSWSHSYSPGPTGGGP